MSQRAQREAWFNELVRLGMSGANAGAAVNQPNFKAARNAFEHARGVYSAARQRTPPPAPPAPAPIKQAQAPRRLDADSDGGNLKIKKKSRRKSAELSKGTGQLRINRSTAGVTSGMGASSGGINV